MDVDVSRETSTRAHRNGSRRSQRSSSLPAYRPSLQPRAGVLRWIDCSQADRPSPTNPPFSPTIAAPGGSAPDARASALDDSHRRSTCQRPLITQETRYPPAIGALLQTGIDRGLRCDRTPTWVDSRASNGPRRTTLSRDASSAQVFHVKHRYEHPRASTGRTVCLPIPRPTQAHEIVQRSATRPPTCISKPQMHRARQQSHVVKPSEVGVRGPNDVHDSRRTLERDLTPAVGTRLARCSDVSRETSAADRVSGLQRATPGWSPPRHPRRESQRARATGDAS